MSIRRSFFGNRSTGNKVHIIDTRTGKPIADINSTSELDNLTSSLKKSRSARKAKETTKN